MFILIFLMLAALLGELLVLSYAVLRQSINNRICRAFAVARWWTVLLFVVWLCLISAVLLATETTSKKIVMGGIFPFCILPSVISLDLNDGLLRVTRKNARQEIDEDEQLVL
jgi:hypothetical protein